MQARNQRSADGGDTTNRGGSGSGEPPELVGARVAKLEAYMDVTRGDLREIRTDLKAIIGKLGTLPTKGDLSGWRWQWIAASFVIFALIVTSLVGGLAWVATIAH